MAFRLERVLVMNKLKPWILMLLIFLAGFTSGAVAARGVLRHFIQRTVNNPDLFRERIERRIAMKLRLDAAQRMRTHEILIEAHREIKELRGEFQPRFEAIMEKTKTEIGATLNPQQREALEKFAQESRQWWQP